MGLRLLDTTRPAMRVAAACLAASPALAGCAGSAPSTPATATASTTVTTGAAGGAGGSASAGGAGGSAGAGGAGGGHGGAGVAYPAPHADAPAVVSAGGPVLTSPKAVALFFSNDDPGFTAQVKTFLAAFGPSAHWTAATAEYGVGPLASAPVDVPEPMTGEQTEEAIEAWLAGKLNAGDAALPAPEDGSIYTLYLPEDASFVFGGLPSCGAGYYGFHGEIALDAAHAGARVAYAVVARCPADLGWSTLDFVTAFTAHELLEAATDPWLHSDPAFSDVDPAHAYWTMFSGGGELGDMCQSLGQWERPGDLGFVVGRGWSNAAAAAGHEPCVPAAEGAVYFDSAPVLEDDVAFGGKTVKGVKVPAGGTRVVPIDLFSDAPTDGPWKVEVEDYWHAMGQPSKIDLQLDRSEGSNGDRLQMTVTVPAGLKGAQPFLVTSTLGDRKRYWAGIVGN